MTSALSQCLDDLTRGDKVCQTAVIATTNRPENLHASIRRAGRLDNEIEVPVPNNKGNSILNNLTLNTKPYENNTKFKLY